MGFSSSMSGSHVAIQIVVDKVIDFGSPVAPGVSVRVNTAYIVRSVCACHEDGGTALPANSIEVIAKRIIALAYRVSVGFPHRLVLITGVLVNLALSSDPTRHSLLSVSFSEIKL